jgi:hypothetical protein
MGMKWFVLVIVGFLVWAYLSNPLNRGKIAQFNRKARRAGKAHSRLVRPPSQG